MSVMSSELTYRRPDLPPELPVTGFDCVEFYVGNARQTAYFYNTLFGFEIIAYRGPETGKKDTASYVLRQNDITIVITSALFPEHEIAQHVARHGDGIKDIAFRCEDVTAAYTEAIRRGATGVLEPNVRRDTQGEFVTAAISTYGDTTHTFMQRTHYQGLFAPEYEPFHVPAHSIGLQAIDHAVGNVEMGQMDRWVKFYEDIFGFYVFRYYDENDISTQYSALVSKVMANQSETIKMPINEPAPAAKKSQIQEYIDFYRSAGVQHLAISTQDIVSTVGALRQKGFPLMQVPQTYYDGLRERNLPIAEDLDDLAKLGILVDEESGGYLLQIFTQPVQDRPTFFFEIIQRCGADGFGKGNFKALFEAIERDQARRGNL